MPDDSVIREQGPELLAPSEAVFDLTRAYRYRLTRTWNQEWPPVTWIMLNPSTADAFSDDPTVRRCTHFSRAIAAGGMTIVNLFAYRATQPSELRSAADPVGTLADRYIREACCEGALTVAAWGANGDLAGRADAVTRMLREAGVQLSCLGVTRDGHPRHPLYVPGSVSFAPYPKLPPEVRECRHCNGPIHRCISTCATATDYPLCKGWRHVGHDDQPVIGHCCGGRSINPAAEPREDGNDD